MMDYLPEELLLNIFDRLPVKSQGVCMCVNKRWLSLIEDPSFVSSNTIAKHHSNSKSKLLILWENPYELQLLVDNDRFNFYEHLNLPFDEHDEYPNEARISVCNGVICLAKDESTIVLWNPTIRKILTLPTPTLTQFNHLEYCQLLGFAFDFLENDYKVIRILHFEAPCKSEIEIFSLKSNSWKNASQIAPKCDFWGSSPAFFNGALHWIGHNNFEAGSGVVLCFDVNAEVFTEIELPDCLEFYRIGIKLSVYMESSIAVCCSDMFEQGYTEIWVMNEYGNADSWTNIWKLDETELSLRAIGVPSDGEVLGLRNNGEVFWKIYRQKIISIDPESKEEKDVAPNQDTLSCDEVIRYFEESLVLLDNVDAENYTVYTSDDDDSISWEN